MAMPTSNERRTIARRLRRCSPTLDNALTFFRVFEAVYGTLPEDGAAMGMPRHLADLIDRPTCHISETDHEFEDSVRCDRCQVTFNRPWEPFKFCPSCGAEVIE